MRKYGCQRGKYQGVCTRAVSPVSTTMTPSSCSMAQAKMGSHSDHSRPNRIWADRALPVPRASVCARFTCTQPVCMGWIFGTIELYPGPMADEWHRGEYIISTDQARLDIAMIHAYLSGSAYWALGRSLEVVRRSIE